MGYKRAARILFVGSGEWPALAAAAARRAGGGWVEARVAATRDVADDAQALAWADLVVTLDAAADAAVRREGPAARVRRADSDARDAKAAIEREIEGIVGGLKMLQKNDGLAGVPPAPEGDSPEQVAAWRKLLRPALIARRGAMADDERERADRGITFALAEMLPLAAGWIVGFCWPYKGEYDARFPVRTLRERGAQAALPAVVDKRGPLEFRRWWPGAPMREEVYGIPVPDGTAVVTPHVVLVPPVAFDDAGYRLGYGGGYFDRTLAAAEPRPIAVCVAYELQRVGSTHPQPHDLPMDFIVTEAAIRVVDAAGARRVGLDEARERFAALAAARRLPAVSSAGFSSPPCYAKDFPGYFGET
ncbi:MAG TPA: 5-formyltetrahydrofolate cyclo-ligase [Pelomicrobium sp.]|nr:5-formyltetrahydrofolate cyclo-ligase [Pelomicrobium sp.]